MKRKPRFIDASALMDRICSKECGLHFKKCDLDKSPDTRCVFREYVQSQPTVNLRPINCPNCGKKLGVEYE